MTDPAAAAELAARTSYGRLLALLAAPTGDLALAEDALAGAFEQALTTWARTGIPRNPDGWLLTVARNRQRDVWKSPAHRRSLPLDAVAEAPVSPFDEIDPDAVPDQRLALLFVCAHPAIDPAARTPLMLQTVLGLDAQRIAAAFLSTPAAMSLPRLLVELMPAEAEPKGLLALMLACEARRPARRTPDGGFVPLDEQDR